MRQLSILTTSSETAEALRSALAGFDPELLEEGPGSYRVQVALEHSPQVAAVLAALRHYVTSHDFEPAAVEVDGTRYLLHSD